MSFEKKMSLNNRVHHFCVFLQEENFETIRRRRKRDELLRIIFVRDCEEESSNVDEFVIEQFFDYVLIEFEVFLHHVEVEIEDRLSLDEFRCLFHFYLDEPN